MLFELAFWRFACSGTLLGLYGLTEVLARRAGETAERRPAVASIPRWLNLAGAASLLGFYALIGPAGGAIAGGIGNLIGIALALAAMAARYVARSRRDSATLARMGFYTALPLAVGVPWGWAVLTLPAYALSAWRRALAARRLDAEFSER